MSKTNFSVAEKEVRPLVDFFLNQSCTNIEAPLQSLAEVLGAAIGLKPAAMRFLTLTANEFQTFQNLLHNLHLQFIVEEIPRKDAPQGHKSYDFFLSQNFATAQELQTALHASLALGWCPDNPEDQKLSYQIGRLLGYPETAAHYFAYGPRNEEGIIKHRPDSDHDRYYIHSPDHFHTEYEQFEDILHPTIAELAPKAANLMRQNPEYYWTSAEL